MRSPLCEVKRHRSAHRRARRIGWCSAVDALRILRAAVQRSHRYVTRRDRIDQCIGSEDFDTLDANERSAAHPCGVVVDPDDGGDDL